jgi:hypothetical protein
VEKVKRLGGYEDLEDDTWSGWWSTAQNPETVARVCEIVARDQ